MAVASGSRLVRAGGEHSYRQSGTLWTVATAKVEFAEVQPPSSSPTAALAEAARAVAVRKLGRLRAPVMVAVRFDDQLELEGVSVEITGVTPADEGRITDCLRDIIVVLAREGKRLTTTKVADGLSRQATAYGDTILKTTLSQAVKDEILTNRPDSKPPGYGLPGWP